jgi:hypothetical protein
MSLIVFISINKNRLFTIKFDWEYNLPSILFITMNEFLRDPSSHLPKNTYLFQDSKVLGGIKIGKVIPGSRRSFQGKVRT